MKHSNLDYIRCLIEEICELREENRSLRESLVKERSGVSVLTNPMQDQVAVLATTENYNCQQLALPHTAFAVGATDACSNCASCICK